MQVKYLDLARQFADEGLRQAVMQQFDLTHFVGGSETEKFEERFADICGVACAVGLNSGTDAIFLGLKALGVGDGDEVITVPNSFIATAGAIVAAGAKPVFVDVADDYNIDVTKIEAAITPKTKAIIPVHLTGNPADMPAILDIAAKHKLHTLEDAAQAVTADIGGRRVGSFSDVGCFSLHPLKNLNAAGDAGVATVSDGELGKKILQLRNHGLKNRDEIEFFGYNSRLDSIQAAVVNHGLDRLDEVTEKRIANAKLYDSLLVGIDGVTLPPRREGVRQVFHTYVIQVERRTELMQFLADNEIDTKIHYPVPLHLQGPSRKMGYKEGDFPVCEAQSARILTLPIHQYLEEEQIRFVADTISKFFSA